MASSVSTSGTPPPPPESHLLEEDLEYQQEFEEGIDPSAEREEILAELQQLAKDLAASEDRFLSYFPKTGKAVSLDQLCSVLHSLPRDLVAELHFAIALPPAEQWRAIKILFENICRKSQRMRKLRADLNDLMDSDCPTNEHELEL